jgi:hypothetical protein
MSTGCLNRQRVIVEVPETESVLAESMPTTVSAQFPAPRPADEERLLALPPSDAAGRRWRYLVLHHSGAPVGSLDSIDVEHRQRRDDQGRPWLGIGYHFVIGNGRGMPDGDVQATFRWRQQLAGAHAGRREYNEAGVGICLIGDFREQPPSAAQLSACARLVSGLCREYALGAESVIRHSDIKPTECPGRQFPFEEMAGLPRLREGSLREATIRAAQGF